ncbi:MAG TPA: carboxypeptidase-like regulatory domain-containing protein, partial [Planctomycetota bacterium]|nr:carboxypeptidase-like regulatory domain-containing protein [Planctomycetota bacterium]
EPEGEGGRNLGMIRISVDRAAAPASTGPDGRAVVRPVVPGPKQVSARKADWRSASAPAVAVAGQEIPVSLVLEPGTAVAGRVQDSSGAPVPGATVRAMSVAAGDTVVETRTTAEDGTFRIGGLPGRAVTLRAEKTGFVPASMNSVQPGTTDAVITLEPGGTIVGTVSEPDGKPSAKFRAMAKPEGRPGANPMDWEKFAAESAGEEYHDGRFRIEGVAPGSYGVEGRAERFAPGRAAGVVVEARKETEVAIVLSSGVTVEGIVVRKGDGGPVAGARVRVPAEGMFGEFDMDFDLGEFEDVAAEEMEESRQFFGAFGKGEATTGPDGRFRLEGLEPGGLRLMVSAKGHAPQTVRGLKAPAEQEVRVELAMEAAIEGTVTDMRGAPKAGATIMIQRIPVFMRFGTTDADGRYRVGGLGAGNYLFYVFEAGAALNLRSESVLLKEGETTRKDHKIGDGTKVHGRVTRGGAPVAGVMVMLIPTARSGGPMGMLTGGGGGGFSMGATKDDGSYEITGVSSGRYSVGVQTSMGGNSGGGETIVVPSGAAEVKHDVVLPEAAIRGIVVDETGKPVVGAAVTAMDPALDPGRLTDLGSAMQGMGGQTFTDDGGRFHLADMKAGNFRVRVQAEGRGTEIVEGVSSTSGAELRVVMGTGAEFRVRVLAPDGTPVRGATIFLEDAEGREMTNLSGFDAVRTGEDGRAVVRAPAGTITVEAAARGYASGETKATIPSSEDVTVTLRRGGTIRAKVVGGNGAPVEGAGIEVLDSTGSPLGHRFSMEGISDLLTGATTAADGTWTRADLPAGSWKVRAATQDGRTAEQSVSLSEGETAEVTLRLP